MWTLTWKFHSLFPRAISHSFQQERNTETISRDIFTIPFFIRQIFLTCEQKHIKVNWTCTAFVLQLKIRVETLTYWVIFSVLHNHTLKMAVLDSSTKFHQRALKLKTFLFTVNNGHETIVSAGEPDCMFSDIYIEI